MMAEGRKSDVPRERVHGPSALRRKRVEQREGDRGSTGPLISIPSSVPSENGRTDSESGMIEEEFLHRVLNDGTSDSDEDRGYADPVQDDLHARRVLLSEHQTSVNVDSDKFLPKYWTPEEDLHVQKIRLGSQRRPWYKKLQGFSRKMSGSSEDEPDFDITPWLAAPAPTFSPASKSPHTF